MTRTVQLLCESRSALSPSKKPPHFQSSSSCCSRPRRPGDLLTLVFHTRGGGRLCDSHGTNAAADDDVDAAAALRELDLLFHDRPSPDFGIVSFLSITASASEHRKEGTKGNRVNLIA